MKIQSRFISFGYDEKINSFFIKTTDPEYLKILLAEDPRPTEILFELDENSIRQMCKYFSLKSKGSTNPLPEESLT